MKPLLSLLLIAGLLTAPPPTQSPADREDWVAVDFRKVELLNLSGCRDPKARNFKRYVVHDAPGACVY